MHDVARVDLTQAGAARERRRDLGVTEGRLCVVDGRLIGLHQRFELGDGRLLGICLLCGASLRGGELLVAFQVDPRVRKLRRVLRLLGDSLIVLRLIDDRIDLGEYVTCLDVLPFDEIDLQQFAVHLCAHGHGVQCPHHADAIEINRHVLDLGRGGEHWDRQIRPRTRYILPAEEMRPGEPAEPGYDHETDEQ